MGLKIYINGTYYAKEDAKISVFDHGFLYGDGVFEGMRAYNGKVFRLDAHMDRLFDSMRSLTIESPMSKAGIAKAVNETLAINEIKDGYIRLIVTRGAGTLGLDAHLCSDPQVIVITDHLALYPKELYEQGLRIVTAGTVRTNPASLSPQIKSLNYLNNILAKIEGHLAGCVEALMLNDKGEVAECTGDNIFTVKNGKLRTPPTAAGILEGITRAAVIEIARKEGLSCEEVALTRYDVYTADEVFLTGSAAELIPIVALDGRAIGSGKPGPMFKHLLEKFHEEARA
ncbi:MAG TPA: branched-chain-amino-acid transaminase [Planctomycetaceae bacterium]|nr:branched-chain-amino-acid transaminase [Planctomycetaceae bacterium]